MGIILWIILSALIPIKIFILIIIVSILAIGLIKPQVVSIPLTTIMVIMVTLLGSIISVLVPELIWLITPAL